MKISCAALLLVTGCMVGESIDDDLDIDIAEEESDAALVVAARQPYSTTGDPSPSRDFNPNGKHNDQCVRLRGIAKLRYADGVETGYSINPFALVYNPDVPGKPIKRPLDESGNFRCESGMAQLDVQEIRKAGTMKLYFFRGGSPYMNSGSVRYGFISKDDIDWTTSDAAPASLTANYGLECDPSKNPATDADYKIVPTTIPRDMTFRKSNYDTCALDPPDGKLENCTNGYTSYGNPGMDQGSEATKVPYTYLLWNFTNVQGGGVVRTLLSPTETFHRCNVRPIRQDAYSPDGKRKLGWVQAVYGRVYQGGWMYGWIVHSHYCDPAQPECAAMPGKRYHVTSI